MYLPIGFLSHRKYDYGYVDIESKSIGKNRRGVLFSKRINIVGKQTDKFDIVLSERLKV